MTNDWSLRFTATIKIVVTLGVMCDKRNKCSKIINYET